MVARPARLSVAEVVRRTSPPIKRAVVMGENATTTAEELAKIGVEVVPPTTQHDVILNETREEAPFLNDFVITRVRIAPRSVKGRFTLIDAHCEEMCDAFVFDEREPEHWLTAKDLPLTFAHPNLTWGTGARRATGVIVNGALDLGGDALSGSTRIHVELPHEMRASREILKGWLPPRAIDGLPREIEGLGRVTGTIRFDGMLGFGATHFPPFTKPADAPFAELGTFGTLLDPHIDVLVDGPTIARLNQREDAAFQMATRKLRADAAAPLRDARDAMRRAFGNTGDFGRTAQLSSMIDAFERPERPDHAFALAEARLHAGDSHSAAHHAFLDALYVRACAELTPIVDGTDDALARRAAKLAWKLYEESGKGPEPVHRLAYRRFSGEPDPELNP